MTSMALLCHLRPTIGSESRREMTATNVKAEAENFAAQRGIPPTKLLILVIDLVFARESMRSRANLLVIRDYYSTARLTRYLRRVDALPSYFDVLATAMEVIVISAPYSVFNSEADPDPFQNFRHSCLLHIMFVAKEAELPAVYVNTLLWYPKGARKFACVTYFDHIIYFREEKSMNSCFSRERKCSIGSLTLTRSMKEYLRKGFPDVLVSCNTTNVTAKFCLTCPRQYKKHRSTLRYSHSKLDILECFTLFRPREPNITALIEPLSGGFCVLLSLTILILVKTISSLRIQGFLSCLAGTVFSMIPALPIQGNTQRYSHLFFLSCTLALGFFMGLIYKNFVMSSFLDRKVPVNCVGYSDCRLYLACYSQENLLYDLTLGYCRCSLNYQQRVRAGKPLHRVLLRPDKIRVSWDFLNELHIQIERKRAQRVSLELRGQLVLVMIRVSSTIDRCYQMGIVSIDRLTPGNNRSEYIESDSLKRWFRFGANQRLHKYLDFGPTDDLFDIDRFRKMQPLFGFCLVSVFFVFCCEQFLRARPKTPGRRGLTVPAIDDASVNNGRDSPDRVSRRSVPASGAVAPREEIQRASPSTSIEADTDVSMDV